jgi:hypothetical protein
MPQRWHSLSGVEGRCVSGQAFATRLYIFILDLLGLEKMGSGSFSPFVSCILFLIPKSLDCGKHYFQYLLEDVHRISSLELGL